MSPKSLLRLPEARSSIEEMTENTEFRRVIEDSGPAAENASNVTKLLFCSGKIYYDLAKERAIKDLQADVAITRLEQVGGLYTRQYVAAAWMVMTETLDSAGLKQMLRDYIYIYIYIPRDCKRNVEIKKRILL